LKEGHIAFRVGVPAKGMGDLLQDDQEPDSRQHSLDGGGWKEVPEDTGLRDAEGNLESPGEDDGEKKCLKATQGVDRLEDNDGKARRGPRDAERRSTQHADDDSTDDARDEAGKERGPAGQRDAETQRNGDEENHDTRGEVMSDFTGDLHGRSFLSLRDAEALYEPSSIRDSYPNLKE
jgi:hypothetical protein